MIVISDTSAITSLLQVHRVEILARLYQEIVIPEEVAVELEQYHAALPAFIQVRAVCDRKRFTQLCAELHEGEAAAIMLMIEGKGDLLLIDERRGRKVAQREKLPVIGVVGVLVEARRRRLIPSLKEVIEDLENIAGFRISPKLKARALESVGERSAR
jgi:uncharacterized protein